MLRIAGITTLPGTTPSTDQYAELVPLVNRMLSSWGLDGHKCYGKTITPFALVSGQKTYTIGPGGQMDTPRPVWIAEANVLLPTDPTVRWPVQILDDKQWSSIGIQDIPGAPPYALYYDGGFDANGRGTLSLLFQPPDGYTLELYAWTQLPQFATSGDTAIFPPGYEDALQWNGGIRIAALYPLESKLHPLAFQFAASSLRAVRQLNMRSPKIGTEPGLGSESSGNGRPWLVGPF